MFYIRWDVAVHARHYILAAPRSNNELCDEKIRSAWPQILSIKESLIKYVFEPNQKKGGKVRGGAKGEC